MPFVLRRSPGRCHVTEVYRPRISGRFHAKGAKTQDLLNVVVQAPTPRIWQVWSPAPLAVLNTFAPSPLGESST